LEIFILLAAFSPVPEGISCSARALRPEQTSILCNTVSSFYYVFATKHHGKNKVGILWVVTSPIIA